MKNFGDFNRDRVWLGKLTDVIYNSTTMNYFQIIEAIYLLNHHLLVTNPDLSLRQNCIPLIGGFDLETHAGQCDFPCQLDSRGNHCGFRSAINRPGGRLAKIAIAVAARQGFPYYYHLQP